MVALVKVATRFVEVNLHEDMSADFYAGGGGFSKRCLPAVSFS